MSALAKGKKQKGSAKKRQEFQFIAVSGTHLRGDEATRRKVRSHAQADYRRRQQQCPAPEPIMTADPDLSSFVASWKRQDPPPNLGDSDDNLGGLDFDSSSASKSLVLSPTSPQEVMRSDVYGLLPGNRLRRSQLLWDHLYDGTCVVFKSMLQLGFIDMVRESTALTQMLSASAWHTENPDMGSGSGGMGIVDSDSTRYSIIATQSLRKKLCHPQARASTETVIAVLAFASFGAMISDPELVSIHLDGLSQILGHRGGLRSVESMPVVRIMIYWVDLSAAYLKDEAPRYPQPCHSIALRSKLQLPLTPIDRSPPGEDLSQDPATVRVCDTIRQAIKLIEVSILEQGEAFWGDVLFAPFHLAPILHDLLSMPRCSTEDDIFAQRRGCFRLAAILYITELRKKFGIDDTPAIIYATKLHMVLSNPVLASSWGVSNVFLLWSLTVAASCSCVHEALRADFAKLLRAAVQDAGLQSFEDLQDLISDFMWCNAISVSSMALLNGGEESLFSGSP